jgi:hypothetical protein
MNLNLCDVFRIEVLFSLSAVAAEAADVDIELSLGSFCCQTNFSRRMAIVYPPRRSYPMLYVFLFFALVIPHTFRHLFSVVRRRQENGYLFVT